MKNLKSLWNGRNGKTAAGIAERNVAFLTEEGRNIVNGILAIMHTECTITMEEMLLGIALIAVIRYIWKAKRKRKMKNREVIPIHNLTENTEKTAEEEFIRKTREILKRNIGTEGYTIDKLCTEMGMSRTSFYHKIKRITGKTPAEYIYLVKMEQARELLTQGRHNVTEVADMTGYCDAQYFTKRFKRFYHMTPTEYIRKQRGEGKG